MDVKFLYDIPYVKQMIAYFLIPLLVFIIICSIILLAYSAKGAKSKNHLKYKYKANVFSIIISMLLTVVFLSILLGFSYAFKKQMDAVGLKTVIAYLVLISPVVPSIALLYFFIKLIKVVHNKPPMNVETLDDMEEEVEQDDSRDVVFKHDDLGEVVSFDSPSEVLEANEDEEIELL